MAKKKSIEKSTGNMSMKRIRGMYSHIEHFFIYDLGYDTKTWKAGRTRIFNKLNYIGVSELTEVMIYDILTHIASSTSKYKNNAKELLNKNFTEFDRNNVKSDRYELDVDEEISLLCSKYNISIEDFIDRLDIIKRAMSNCKSSLGEILEEKRNIIKFESDLRALDAIEEYFSQ